MMLGVLGRERDSDLRGLFFSGREPPWRVARGRPRDVKLSFF